MPLKFWLARAAELKSKLRLHLGVLGALTDADAGRTLALMALVARRPEALHDLMEAAVDKAERDANFNALKADGYQPPPADREVLGTFAPGTLAHAVAMQQAGAAPPRLGLGTAPRAANLDDTFEFLLARLTDALPIWRALLDGDELALQAFIYAQTACPLPCLVIAVRLYQTAARSPRQLPEALTSLSRGFRLGEGAPYLLGLRLEDDWGADLATLRHHLGLA
jgi:ubiquinone biosynthesis protein Coq4